MAETILSIEPGGYYFYFWLFSCIALLIGVAVYLILRRPALRRIGFAGLGKASVPVSLVAACLIAVPILVYLYEDSWGYFYALTTDGDRIKMEFIFPARAVELDRSRVSKVKRVVHVRKAHTGYRLVVRTDAGVEHASQLMSREKMRSAIERMRRVLHLKIDT